jgi:ATP-binding cassette subfamily E protein 1
LQKRIVVLQPKCVPSVCNYDCIKVCPVNAKSTEKKPIWAIKVRDKITGKALINENKCLHSVCGICINACPIQAITTINIPFESEDEPPVHKYFDSLFSLYRLPQLSKTRIIGLLGRNAIGKSTLLQILAGIIKPNGGTENGHKQWLDSLSIPGLKKHLLETYKNKEIISHKKQDLRYMLELNGNIGDILQDVALSRQGRGEDELEFFKSYLSLEGIWEKRPSTLSGGELQRFTIASTFLKEAKVYLVDEPCTFLDVKQRIKLRKIFQDRIDEGNKSVFVVEHDIAILDYLTDNVHILFGQPHVFGVVSRALATKKGINSFLEGYLKEENIQFRKRLGVRFTKSVKERNFEDSTIPKLEWDNFKVKLDSFQLKIHKGNLFEAEVLVALGENGLGKTTFVKNLLELLSSTVVSAQIDYGKVSIKPQQINRGFEGTVDQFLTQQTGRYLKNPNDKTHLLKPLGIWHLMNKPVKELSGGELQRVFIGACLGKVADIYCLDEPSAFLDAEERLKITSVIRHMATKKRKPIIVVEHDLQVVDAIADRILLFDGKPGIVGYTQGPFLKREGMNKFLEIMDITFRRDPDTGRSRINKHGSSIDRHQRKIGEYYYSPDKLKDYF